MPASGSANADSIPSFVHITPANVHELNVLDLIILVRSLSALSPPV